MGIEEFEAGAYLLARAILQNPPGARAALRARPAFLAGALLESRSPWSPDEIANLSGLFPWEGLSYSIERGLFGTSAGLNPEGKLCVRVYANRRGKDYLNANVMPKFRPGTNLPVFVVEVDSIRFAKSTPCAGGASISGLGGSATGTLGAWLKKNPSGDFVALSNNHVIADFNKFGPGHDVIQPGAADGGGPADVVGHVEGVVTLEVYDQLRISDTTNLSDVAWFRPSQSGVVDRSIGSPGRWPKGEEDLIQVYRNQAGPVAVSLCGRSSNTVQGTMTGIRSCLFIKEGGKDYYFEDQIEITMSRLALGDSGSLVLTDPGDKIGGLFFALDPGSGVGFANPWQAVKSATNLDFAYS